MDLFQQGRKTRCFSLVLILFLSCADADRIDIDSSSGAGLLLQGGLQILSSIRIDSENGKEISSFRFLGSENFFAQDFSGTISGSQITIQAPFGAVNRLKASFVSTGKSVTMEGIPQESGRTSNDFSSPLIYRITAFDGSIQDYTVFVQPLFQLTDAEQTNCYSACSSNPGQDADYSTGVPTSFQTNVAFSSDSSEPVTLDRQTGLIWKYCAEGSNNTTCGVPDESFFYPQALSVCSSLNALHSGAGYAGISTWRIPEIEELLTLTQHTNPITGFLRLSDFPGGVSSFWTKTEDATDSLKVWSYSFETDQIDTNGKNFGSSRSVRCVSGSPIPNRTFTDLGDGTVRDNRTNLVWQKCTKGQTWSSTSPDCLVGAAVPENWGQALNTCKTLNLAGRIWRLPNINELRSLLDFTSSATVRIDNEKFPHIPPENPKYHSSNSVPGGIIFKVHFGLPEIYIVDGPTSVSFTRCVTDGP
ncbi:DUF1566 domain-containing protein [Leptospira stimsonii]|uniref:Adhesin n=1 Tax=Leptospira stimsonii TaxID=2202203 RepID=A0A396YZS6_9LEPT|nr:DUF1566 domain-containing protein [Leptospira stimsonii]RHX86928.1 adhesin [Leptospira stimsonii]